MNRCFLILGFSVVMAASPVLAEDSAATRMSCTFSTGHAGSYDSGTFSAKAPAELSFEVSEIDLESQTATIVLGTGEKGPLKIVRALNANHFLEVANEGFLNLTTIYDVDAGTGQSPAVHSRHFGILGQPVFAQYTGFCKPVSDN